MSFTDGILTVLVLLSAAADLLYGVIPNRFTAPAFFMALAVRICSEGAGALIGIAVTEGCILLILLPLWCRGRGKGIGGGDIKLLLATAACMSPESFLAACAVSMGGALIWGLARGGGRKHGIRLAGFIAMGALLHVGGLY